jgi:predicted RNase H-like nuclease (RuvC/YqgF family)
MADPIVFDLTSPATWLPSLAAAGLGIYGVVRVFRRDSRNDKQEKQIDEAVQQIITNLRNEVERLTERMTNMEAEIVHLHEDRAGLLAKLAECEAFSKQSGLFYEKR